MTRPPVAVLDYGVGNLHSAAKALDRAGADVRVVATVDDADGAAGLGDGTRFYFVHSYAPEPDGDAVAAVCDYGGRFAAAVEHGNLFGTQFHPEKSGAAGLALLANFVAEVRAA